MKLFLALLVSLSTVYAQYNKPFIVERPSMEPAYHAKDRLAVDTTYYQEHSFQRGDNRSNSRDLVRSRSRRS